MREVHGAMSGFSACRLSEVFGGFTWQEAELPAVASRTNPHVGAGPHGIANLVYTVPLVEVGPGGRIDNQPALFEPHVSHGCADSRAHDAVGPVAAQHEFGVHIVLGPVRPIDERDPYPAVAFFFDLCDFDVA